jgi:hypothetical protein
MKYQKQCDHCGHQETAYAHPLNRGLVLAFKALAEYYLANRRACNVNRELNLSHNQLANFQKLRYFGLVSDTPQGWYPSPLGLEWYRGEVSILNPAGSLSNVPLADDHEAWKTHAKKRTAVRITDYVAVEYKKRDEYAGERLF